MGIPNPKTIVKNRDSIGIVLDSFPGAGGDTLLEIWWVKNLFRQQKPELIPFSMLSLEPATDGDVLDEIKMHQARLSAAMFDFQLKQMAVV